MRQQPLSVELNWEYAKVTYPTLTAVIGSDQAWRELMLLLSAVEERARRSSEHN